MIPAECDIMQENTGCIFSNTQVYIQWHTKSDQHYNNDFMHSVLSIFMLLLHTQIEQIWFNARVDLLLVILSLRVDTMTHLLPLVYIFISTNALDLSWLLWMAFPPTTQVHLPMAPYAQSLNSMKLAVVDGSISLPDSDWMLMYSQSHKKWEPCDYFVRKFIVGCVLQILDLSG
jgi:hypothetical protein